MKQVSNVESLQKKRKGYANIGLVLCALSVLIPVTTMKVVLGSLIFLNLGMILYLEKRIKNIRFKEEEEKETNELRKKCLNKIKYIENLFVINGFSINLKENYILSEIYDTYNCNLGVRWYKNFSKELDMRIEYVIDFIDMRKRWENEAKFRERFQQKADVYASTSSISKYLKVLGLSEDTTDIEAVKKAYRSLIKTCHPDKYALASKEEKARVEELSKGINEAYDELSKLLKAS
jgi:DnaJ-class molecular chaperone with C-terminal Zn finger domain